MIRLGEPGHHPGFPVRTQHHRTAYPVIRALAFHDLGCDLGSAVPERAQGIEVAATAAGDIFGHAHQI